MTKKQRAAMKKAREKLRQEGILPPPKKRLNREKYAKQIKTRFDSMGWDPIVAQVYILQAITLMTPLETIKSAVTPEQVGVLKMMHMAMDLYEFERRKSNAGKSGYTVGEVYEQVIKPIWEL